MEFARQGPLRNPRPDAGPEVHRPELAGHHGLFFIGKHRTLAAGTGLNQGRPVGAKDHVFGRRHDRLAVGRLQEVHGGEHNLAGLPLRLLGQRHVHRHLVAVEIGVEGRADHGVDLDGLALDEHRLEGLDAEAVERRGAVQEHDPTLVNDLLQERPDLRGPILDHAARAADVVRELPLDELPNHERLEELEGHLLGQAALVELELRAHDDDRAAGIVHPLAEEILAEAALLALQHVGERLQRPPLDL